MNIKIKHPDKLSLEKIAKDIEKAKNKFYVASTNRTRTDLKDIYKDVIPFIIIEGIKEGLQNAYILCSEKTKFKLLEYFWQEDFCYLGTKIKLISTEFLDPEKFDMIFYNDPGLMQPYGYIECMV